MICICVSEKLIMYVKNAETAHKAWTSLNNAFGVQGLTPWWCRGYDVWTLVSHVTERNYNTSSQSSIPGGGELINTLGGLRLISHGEALQIPSD